MTDDDVVSGLEGLDALVKDPQTGIYGIRVNPDKLVERVNLVEKKGYVKVKEELLKWTPYLLGRKEAKEMLESGLEELIHRRDTSLDSFGPNDTSNESEEVAGKDIPVERFVNVAVRGLVPAPNSAYDTMGSQTPLPPDTQRTSEGKSPSTSTAEEDILDDRNISSPSSASVANDDVSDEPYSAEEFDEDDEEEMSDYISDNSNDSNTRHRKPRKAAQKPDKPVVVPVKHGVAKAPKSRAALGPGQDSEVSNRPKVIAAKAPKSRAGMNPPEVMSRRASLRKM
jgi:hypothetical protein